MRAARLVFSERGYEGTTFQAIAVRADLTRPAVNHYFPSKHELYREVADQTNQVLVAAAEMAPTGCTLIERLAAFLVAVRQSDVENPGTAAFLVTHVLESQRHPELNTAENDSVQLIRNLSTCAVRDAIERGEVARDIDAIALVETLVLVLCGTGFYGGYLRSHHEMSVVIEMLRRLLEGALWRPQS